MTTFIPRSTAEGIDRETRADASCHGPCRLVRRLAGEVDTPHTHGDSRAVGVPLIILAALILVALSHAAAWLLPAAAVAIVCVHVLRREARRHPDADGTALSSATCQPAPARYPLGYDAERVRELVDRAAVTITRLRRLVSHLPDSAVRDKASTLCDLAGRIVGEVRRDPKNIEQARRFFSYYMDAAHRIVARYAQLAFTDASAEVRATLERVEPTLDALIAALARLLDDLQRDEAVDLDAELSVLERSVQLG